MTATRRSRIRKPHTLHAACPQRVAMLVLEGAEEDAGRRGGRRRGRGDSTVLMVEPGLRPSDRSSMGLIIS